MSKRTRELLFQIGLVLGSIVVGKLLDSPLGYVVAAILAVAFIVQWLLQRDEVGREVEMEGLFAGSIPEPERSSAQSNLDITEVRPKIVPVDYGKDEIRGVWGLHIRNSGYDALDVEIPDVLIGRSGYSLEFPGRLAQFGERSGIGFLEAWLKHDTLPGVDGSQLHKVMREADVESVELSIVYKDTDLQAKKTECAIERSNRERHGLLVRATSAPGISAQSKEKPRTQTNLPEQRVQRDWAREWKELERRFSEYRHSGVRAHYFHHAINQREYWDLQGASSLYSDPLKSLCDIGGALLSASPHIQLPENIKSVGNGDWRWLYFLKANYSRPAA